MPKAPDHQDCELIVTADGDRLRLYPPILGTTCTSCAEQTDDVCFLIEARDGSRLSGGLCGRCAISLLRGFAAAAPTTA